MFLSLTNPEDKRFQLQLENRISVAFPIKVERVKLGSISLTVRVLIR